MTSLLLDVFRAVLGTTHFAQEALAGLASKEDFTNVALRKTDPASRSSAGEHLPYSELMLLHVKGKSHLAAAASVFPASIDA